MKTNSIRTALAGIVLSCIPLASQAYTELTVGMTDGTSVTLHLSSELKAEFNQHEMVFTDGTDINVAIMKEKIKEFTFGGSNAVDRIDSGIYDAKIKGNTISFTGLPESTDIAIYTRSGVLVTNFTTEGDTFISLDGYTPGLYLVTFNKNIIKFIVK